MQFSGNSDWGTVVSNYFEEAYLTQYIKIRPKGWTGHLCMRIELLGCDGKYSLLIRMFLRFALILFTNNRRF